MAENSDVNSDVWFSADELAEFALPGYPRSGRRIHDRAKAEGWKSREVPSQGRKGFKVEYSPPADVLHLIKTRRSSFPASPQAPDRPYAFESPGAPTPPQATESALPPVAAPEGFVLVPRYNVSGSMGNGQVIHSEQVVDHLAFKADWVRTELGTNPSHLVLISAVGDSMEPTLRAHDLLLIDRSVQSVKQDAIYAFAVEGELRVKRIQRLFDGSLVIKSDNQAYGSETLSPDQAGAVNIIGRVAWSGRRM